MKVFFSCSGVGILNRGIESFFREAFDGLRGTDGLDLTLYKGAGESKRDERILWNLPRTGAAARFLGACVRRNGYVVEQLSTFPSMARAIRRERPQVIFFSDSNLGFQLFRWREQIGVPFRLLFSNGGPCRPPFDRTDFVHQVVPHYHEEALRAGEPAARQFMVPYGIRVPQEAPTFNEAERQAFRIELGLPLKRAVILSVGWISREQKRMDYLIGEVARMPQPRPFLQLLGAMDCDSRGILQLAERLLGPDGFGAASVPYESVSKYYQAADCFVLASLKEGFGRVFLEALMHGLPVIAHRHPVMEYVVGTAGRLEDLSQSGALAGGLREVLIQPRDDATQRQRWTSVRDRFGWEALRPKYHEMFQRCAFTN